MARSRILKPGFFTNELLAELPFAGRLLFAGLWTLADREGRLEDRPKRIKAALFPWDEVDVDPLLVALESRGFIDRYDGGGYPLIQIAKFNEHQTPHQRETASIHPAPKTFGNSEPSQGDARPSPRSPVSVSVSDPVSVSVDSSEALTRSEPAFLVFPTVGTGKKAWALMERQLAEWTEAYPNLDIKAEARKALAWIQANPGRRKTDRGMLSFLVNWLNRATDHGGATRGGGSASAGKLTSRMADLVRDSQGK
jgi:hypothetical protein